MITDEQFAKIVKPLSWYSSDRDKSMSATSPATGKNYQIFFEEKKFWPTWEGGIGLPGVKTVEEAIAMANADHAKQLMRVIDRYATL